MEIEKCPERRRQNRSVRGQSGRLAESKTFERTQSGIIRAKAAGKQFGRPPALNGEERAAVVQRLDAGATIAEIAREFKTTRQTIMRVREAKSKP